MTHRPSSWFLSIVMAACLIGALAARADVRLPGMFSDNMVLQQGIKVPVWGWAADGESVTVKFRGQTVTVVAKNGRWMVQLTKLKAGGPDEFVVTGNNTITLKNVLVGEVWVASGQSNMAMALRDTSDPKAEIDASANPSLRLFTVPTRKADAPLDDVKATWQECNAKTSPGFSAVGYFFGRDLRQARGVPVGIIHTSWGGSPAEVWMSQDVLETNPDYKRDILDPYPKQLKAYEENLAQWEKEAADLKKQGKEPARGRPWPAWKPAELYNGMIAPLLPYAIHGAIWYQGEGNAGRAWQYRTLFADLIRNWRRDWKQGDFTFLAVQLAPFTEIKKQPVESDWAELREAQVLATQTLPKVGVAVITDVGDEKDIHPKNKAPVGARLALAARAIAYGEKIEYSGPAFRSLKVRGQEAVLSFAHVAGGLEARGGDLTGFAICGADRKWVWGKAQIQGDKIVVTSPEVAQPVAVRFGWANYPVVNLWNKAGLPASPFRTDDFPLTTMPKK